MLSSCAAVSPRLDASFPFLRIDVMQDAAICLDLLCSMPCYLDTLRNCQDLWMGFLRGSGTGVLVRLVGGSIGLSRRASSRIRRRVAMVENGGRDRPAG